MEKHADEKHEEVNRKEIEQCAVAGIKAQDKKQNSTPEKQLRFHQVGSAFKYSIRFIQ